MQVQRYTISNSFNNYCHVIYNKKGKFCSNLSRVLFFSFQNLLNCYTLSEADTALYILEYEFFHHTDIICKLHVALFQLGSDFFKLT